MNFENYGSYWVIDHVYPCSKYEIKTDIDLQECFNWRNLRPYKLIKNQKKTNQINENDLNNHIKLIKNFWKNISHREQKKFSQ